VSSEKNTVVTMVMNYKEMERHAPNSSMLQEVKWQYADMAAGGDGGDLGFEEKGETTCRAVNYPGYPDEFFQEVRNLMGWV